MALGKVDVSEFSSTFPVLDVGFEHGARTFSLRPDHTAHTASCAYNTTQHIQQPDSLSHTHTQPNSPSFTHTQNNLIISHTPQPHSTTWFSLSHTHTPYYNSRSQSSDPWSTTQPDYTSVSLTHRISFPCLFQWLEKYIYMAVDVQHSYSVISMRVKSINPVLN